MALFTDRRSAGRALAARLGDDHLEAPVVAALPRGGVPVAAEVARELDAPLDVLVVRKLGCPWRPELGVGAVGEGGVQLLNDRLIQDIGVTPSELQTVIDAETAELERRAIRYRGQREPADLAGRTVVIVDDGLATGFTARAAIELARARGATRVVLAVPVAPLATVAGLAEVADEVVCLQTPDRFPSIGTFYRDFAPTRDAEVRAVLDAEAGAPVEAGGLDARRAHD